MGLVGLPLAAAAGAGAVYARTFTLAALVLGACLAIVLRVPIRQFAVAVLLGTAAVPAVLIEAQAHGLSLSATPFQGQGRMVLFLAALAAVSVWLRGRERLTVAPALLIALAAYFAGLLLSVATAYIRGSDYPGMLADLARQLSYPTGAAVGVLAGLDARRRGPGGRLSIYRAIAVVGVVICSSACVYWLWATARVTTLPAPLVSLFQDVTRYSGSQFALERSIFPFSDQSPISSALIYVFLASFCIPPLVARRSRLDLGLAGALAGAAVFAVFSTQSREGVIALLAAPLPALVLLGRRLRVIVGACSLVGAVALVGATQLFPQQRQLSFTTPTLQSRYHVWSQALRLVPDAPLLGQGFNFSGRPHYVEKLPRVSGQLDMPRARLIPVHDQYIERLVDGGAVGLGIFAIVVAALIALTVGLQSKHSRALPEAIGWASTLSALVVSMVGGSSLDTAAVAILVWLFAGWASTAVVEPP